ncbi:MAG: membrane dipeptidase [Anaerolineae bacterium]|nr:membrane dipeptidase [Anaerolineae bacterium]
MTYIIVDAHQDLAWNMRDHDRDFRLSAYAKRKAEAGTPIAEHEGLCMTGLPEALLGRVAVIFATIFANPKGSPYSLPSRHAYSTPAEAHQIGMSQLDYYHELADSHPNIALIRDKSELEGVLVTWQPDVPFEQHKVGLVVLMEGADPIREPKAFEEWYARGVRIVGLAWSQTRYSGGTAAPGGLTKLGRELLEVMASFRAVLDVSHMAEKAFFEALDSYDGQIIASHSNPRHFRNSDRHLSDAMIRRLIERDGVIGVVPYNSFLWEPDECPLRKADAPLSRVAEVIDHICQIAGSARHVGIGTDFDGGFGADSTPEGLDTVADLLSLAPLLAARGYSDSDIAAILSGNFLRVLRAALL